MKKKNKRDSLSENSKLLVTRMNHTHRNILHASPQHAHEEFPKRVYYIRALVAFIEKLDIWLTGLLFEQTTGWRKHLKLPSLHEKKKTLHLSTRSPMYGHQHIAFGTYLKSSANSHGTGENTLK